MDRGSIPGLRRSLVEFHGSGFRLVSVAGHGSVVVVAACSPVRAVVVDVMSW